MINTKVTTWLAILFVMISIIILFILPLIFPNNTVLRWVKSIVSIIWIIGLVYDIFFKKKSGLKDR